MPSTLGTFILLTLATLLASCGGSSTPSSAIASPSPNASCDSTTLWAAHPAPSGRAIPDLDGTGISVNWDNQNCTVRTISSAVLEICLKHPRTSDLSWTLTPPAPGVPWTLTPPANWNTSGTACGSDGEKMQRIDLLPTVSTTLRPVGNWTLNVKDQLLGDAGTLIQWRLLIQGQP